MLYNTNTYLRLHDVRVNITIDNFEVKHIGIRISAL